MDRGAQAGDAESNNTMTTPALDPATTYDLMLDKGIRLSGEGKRFFILGRLNDLRRALPTGFCPRRILDFGCGVGDTTRLLAETFPTAELVGADTAIKALDYAKEHYGNARISFEKADGLSHQAPFHLCYVNGVFHHIPPADRNGVMETIFRALSPGGYVALFENNPLNPGARMVMKRIPFDRDARPITPRAARRMLREAGFETPRRTRFLFYFPRRAAFLRFVEPRLVHLPFGAQYHCLARRPRNSIF
ncbi:MAG: class I SAM-dependent methyltransferase [Deltaproteobacteria bacterium]|nr:class I SAM-dependent methyltransferase [Deltaproteobacteria bacterium]MBW1817896.1 class I SAM-dependent methyltransferase [Deltaproteobacteria bacterium]MBW2283571.1 class I SAM-dependent methyltransferase [Deltaproteobacteria bacterium]